MWRSCSGKRAEQPDCVRLTDATNTLKDQGWNNDVMGTWEWVADATPDNQTVALAPAPLCALPNR
ncbi:MULTISPECIES: hypothetical protein [Serratia]|uniref:hypothetical protein n=1 Tax=Serratia TaxID=613 RepID=UPI00137932EB|nr:MULTISPECIES: hypothetical protein [Serratia]